MLIVSDDEQIAGLLMATYQLAGYEAERVDHERLSGQSLSVKAPDLVILHSEHPASRAVSALRAPGGGYRGPLLVVSDSVDEVVRVDLLDSGADDHLAIPFSLAELHARTRALLRRPPSVWHGRSQLAADKAARRILVGEAMVELTGREFDVFTVLADAAGSVVRRDELLTALWGGHVSAKTVSVTVGRVRAKLRAAGSGARVVAVRGVGFRLDDRAGCHGRGGRVGV